STTLTIAPRNIVRPIQMSLRSCVAVAGSLVNASAAGPAAFREIVRSRASVVCVVMGYTVGVRSAQRLPRATEAPETHRAPDREDPRRGSVVASGEHQAYAFCTRPTRSRNAAR